MMLLYLMYERTLLEKVTVGDLIVCSEFSRLGRNLFIIMEILNQCMTKECRVGR
ncbi:MAG: recombinase family protein [Eisenbergiella sp.]